MLIGGFRRARVDTPAILPPLSAKPPGDSTAVRSECELIISALITQPDQHQFGKTKIFLRAGIVADLEKLRAETVHAAATALQKRVRGLLARKHYVHIRSATLTIQSFARGMKARQEARVRRQMFAATRIQTLWRRWRAMQQYARVVSAVRFIQRVTRGLFGRRQFRAAQRARAVLQIQTWFRGARTRRLYLHTRQAIIIVQSCIRRRRARLRLRQLRVEARSVEGLRQRTWGLENKIIELQRKLDGQTSEVHGEHRATIAALTADVATARQRELVLVATTESTSALHRQEIQRLQAKIASADVEMASLSAERTALRSDHVNAVSSLHELVSCASSARLLLQQLLRTCSPYQTVTLVCSPSYPTSHLRCSAPVTARFLLSSVVPSVSFLVPRSLILS